MILFARHACQMLGILMVAGILLICAGLARAASGGLDSKPVDFSREIRPILSRCVACHGPATQENGVRLDNARDARKLKAIVPGRPDESSTIKRITSTDPDLRMPPPDSGPALSARETDLLKRWIAAGAEYARHWAFEPLAAVKPPLVEGGRALNGIDPFVLKKLQSEGLEPSPPADRATLLRRASLDLVGLPPTVAEIQTFEQDRRPDAYARQVRRLLASPRYGERQARHWLDLARYADSNGYTIDGPRSMWPWRDWVIRAINQDMPFDRFTTEQLAGDLIPAATADQILATGFHRNTAFNEEGGTDPEQFRVERTIDRTNTTGSVWLGLTVGCAQCHDHKYDPLPQRDYYQLYAYFNNADEPKVSVLSPANEIQIKKLKARLASLQKNQPNEAAATLPLNDEINLFRSAGRNAWQVAPAVKAEAKRARLAVQPDQSILASGSNDTADSYKVTVKTTLPRVTAIRLETLTDPTLPKTGPGRASNGNFILSRIKLKYNGQELSFSAADADLQQAGYPAGDAISAKPGKGWAINPGAGGKLNEPRTAVFKLSKELNVAAQSELVVELQFPEHQPSYTIGKFRISVTDAADSFLELPVTAQKIITSTLAPLETAQKQTIHDLIQLKSKKIDPESVAIRDEIRKLEESVTSLAMAPAAKPRQTHVFQRGDFLQPGEPVLAKPPGVFDMQSGDDSRNRSQQTRLDLARWLTDPKNPLVSRVTVNREWQKFFGSGLVDTENDFGTQGALPTHPELLDYLAARFMAEGWSLKRLHFLIVTSSTYQQASNHRPDLTRKDPQNKLLGRQNRLRLDAEIIRDNALAVSGKLAGKIGGVPVFPPQPVELFQFTQSQRGWKPSEGEDRYRRGLYTWIWRQSRHPLLTTFDAADAQTACTRRGRSNTPLQALHLANDPVFVELAEAWARKSLNTTGKQGDQPRLEQMYLEAFGRKPAQTEVAIVEKLLIDERTSGRTETQAWTTIARLLMNTDEFITRE